MIYPVKLKIKVIILDKLTIPRNQDLQVIHPENRGARKSYIAMHYHEAFQKVQFRDSQLVLSRA